MSKSSKGWLKEHFDDQYVKKSQMDGYRSRASYKLIEINDKDKLIKPGMTVVDLGSAPGGWSQVAADLVGHKGFVVASDILEMDALAGVRFVQGDFREDDVFGQILAQINDQPVDLVISDMAPNMSGNKGVDQPRAIYLMDLALDLARQVLKPGGNFLIKAFQGEGIDQYRQELQQSFAKLQVRKPDSSRDRSREVYLLAKGFKA